MPKPNWSADEEKKLLELWEQRKSVREICEALPGRNRNMVIGKVHRLKFLGRKVETRDNPVKRKITVEPETPVTQEPDKNELYCAEPGCTILRQKGSYCMHHASIYYRAATRNEQKELKATSSRAREI